MCVHAYGWGWGQVKVKSLWGAMILGWGVGFVSVWLLIFVCVSLSVSVCFPDVYMGCLLHFSG